MKHSNININSLSYTNKDFRSIMGELLELVPELTNKWNPNDSNESDPGVALLKIKAFIADKLNYNIDKNVLETFPTTVTQRGNAEKLYDLLGYEMQWYRSATVPVLFSYVQGDNAEEIVAPDGAAYLYTIPKFTTLKDSTGSVVYTLLEEVQIEKSGQSDTTIEKLAIEGPIQSYVINGSEKITIQNLDADYRLYFTESMIAQNGIFVSSNKNMQDLWTRVTNLETADLDNKIFKFGVLPNSNTCYIEFPQDAASLFNDGIYIKYIISSGSAGNISMSTLSDLQYTYMVNGNLNSETKEFTVNPTGTSEIDLALFTKCTNYAGSTNGKDPESLGEAYRNYKKTVGTFNTLVTTKDYESAIYNSSIVSNAVVADRTDDHARSYFVKTFALDGKSEELVNIDPGTPDTQLMNAFDLTVYALNKSTAVNDATSYNQTFKTSKNAMELAQTAVNDYKSIQHDWISNYDQTPFLYKNLYELSGKILTYQKVSSIEASEIEKNVQKALYKAYSSDNINFGEPLVYEDLVETVVYADERIKDFILDEPEIKTYTLDISNTNYSQAHELTAEEKLDIIAKSILAGVTPFCLFDKTIPLDLRMQETEGIDPENTIVRNIKSITTSTEIDIPSNATGITLRTNETVQFYCPNYVTVKTFSTYLYVAFVGNGTGDFIPANSIYQLNDNEYLYVAENKDDLYKLMGKTPVGTPANLPTYSFGKGTIFKTTIELTDSSIENLQANNTIEIQEENVVTLNADAGKKISACWSVNNMDNLLFDANDYRYYYKQTSQDDNGNDIITKIYLVKDGNSYKEQDTGNSIPANTIIYCECFTVLKNGEYFIYTDAKKSFIALLSSGTRLKIDGTLNILKNQNWTCTLPNISEINNYGTASNTDWIELGTGYDFFIQEMQIISLGEGCKIRLPLASTTAGANRYKDGEKIRLSNDPIKISSEYCVEYQVANQTGDEWSELPKINLQSSDSDAYSWYGFSQLQFISSPTTSQVLQKGQYIKFISANGTTVTATGYDIPENSTKPAYYRNTIKTSLPVMLTGGKNQSVEVLQADGTYSEILSAVIYSQDNTAEFWSYDTSSYDRTKISESYADDSIVLTTNQQLETQSFSARLNSALFDCIIPVTIQSDNLDLKVSFTYTDDNGAIKTWKLLDTSYAKNLSPRADVYFLCLSKENDTSSLAINLSIDGIAKGVSVILYKPQKLIGYNKIEGVSTEAIHTRLQELTYSSDKPQLPVFDYTYEVDEDSQILNPILPESFFESNHIRNKFIISQIDTEQIKNITVAKQSRK